MLTEASKQKILTLWIENEYLSWCLKTNNEESNYTLILFLYKSGWLNLEKLTEKIYRE